MAVKEGRRRRYIAFYINGLHDENVQISDFIRALNFCCNDMFDKQTQEMKIRVISLNKDYGIVRCKHVEKENVIALLNSINKIGSRNVTIKTVGTSGTLHALRKKYLKKNWCR